MLTEVSRAGRADLYSIFRTRAQDCAGDLAIEDGSKRLTYAELLGRVDRLAAVFLARGVAPGDRIAILSHNRSEYLEVELAAAGIGAIVACLNWRLARDELRYCIDLVEPDPRTGTMVDDPEAGLTILYTSRTMGLPKGPLISHRAHIARSMAFAAQLALDPGDGFIVWAPMFHMAFTDHALATVLRGGTVVMVDGLQPAVINEALSRYRIGWFVMMPGALDAFIAERRANPLPVKGIKVCGAMADLVPPHQIAELTALLDTPYPPAPFDVRSGRCMLRMARQSAGLSQDRQAPRGAQAGHRPRSERGPVLRPACPGLRIRASVSVVTITAARPRHHGMALSGA